MNKINKMDSDSESRANEIMLRWGIEPIQSEQKEEPEEQTDPINVSKPEEKKEPDRKFVAGGYKQKFTGSGTRR
jgi:hypothetical protein